MAPSTKSRQVKKRKKTALGRGLDALIPTLASVGVQDGELFQCDIELIQPNRYQPRRQFPAEELQELSQSIQQQGILQPLLVCKNDTGYELVAGERRLRAAKAAGLSSVPVILKDLSEAALLEMSLVENIQRQNLNPIEEAEAYHRLMHEFNLTQEQIAERVGKSRSAIANFLRLRQLPPFITASIIDGTLSMGHARALLGAANVTQQQTVWRLVIAKGLSVRQTEDLVKRLKIKPSKPAPPSKDDNEAYFADLTERLSRHLGTKVYIRRQGNRGRIEIDYYSDVDLDHLIQRLRNS